MRILIAEDDQDVRLGLARILEIDGYEVVSVSSGAELLDLFTAWLLDGRDAPRADVVVTDVRMPGFNGLSIVEGLRASGWTRPMIVISAFGDDDMRERLYELDGVSFLAKPFEPEDLESILSALALHSLQADRS